MGFERVILEGNDYRGVFDGKKLSGMRIRRTDEESEIVQRCYWEGQGMIELNGQKSLFLFSTANNNYYDERHLTLEDSLVSLDDSRVMVIDKSRVFDEFMEKIYGQVEQEKKGGVLIPKIEIPKILCSEIKRDISRGILLQTEYGGQTLFNLD